jgi:hypothetical protein
MLDACKKERASSTEYLTFEIPALIVCIYLRKSVSQLKIEEKDIYGNGSKD